MTKYLFVVPSLSKGGAEKVVSILANELIRNNKEVIIIKHFHTNHDYFVDDKVKVICLSGLVEDEYRKKMTPLFFVKLLFELRKNIKKEKADYILPFLYTTCIRVDLALLFSKEKKKVIQTVRNNPCEFPKKTIVRKYRDFLIKKYPKTIVQNSEQKMYFKKAFHNKIFILNNPVDENIFSIKKMESKDKIEIIGVGRLEEQKNFSLLIDAFYELYKGNKNTRLSIYGEGSLREKLQNQINDLGIEKVAILKGRSNDYNKIYGNASIFVLSSNAEGMPNSLIEAMALGIPSVSTNCPTGPSDIIKHNNGILVDMNDKEMMKESIEKLINDTKLYNEISKNAKKTVQQKYTVKNITKQFIDICEKY